MAHNTIRPGQDKKTRLISIKKHWRGATVERGEGDLIEMFKYKLALASLMGTSRA